MEIILNNEEFDYDLIMLELRKIETDIDLTLEGLSIDDLLNFDISINYKHEKDNDKDPLQTYSCPHCSGNIILTNDGLEGF